MVTGKRFVYPLETVRSVVATRLTLAEDEVKRARARLAQCDSEIRMVTEQRDMRLSGLQSLQLRDGTVSRAHLLRTCRDR
jgi:hypothetical protein